MYVSIIFLERLFSCILHAKAAVYMMAALIYKPKYADKE